MQEGQQQSQRDNPFQGPRPFTKADKDWFFGRNDETDELLSLILGHKVVLVYAQSGAGKTSLLNAKIIPELEENKLHVLPVARVEGYQEMQETSEPPEDSDNKAKAVVGQSSSSGIPNGFIRNPFMYNAIHYLIGSDTSDKFPLMLSNVTTFSELLKLIDEKYRDNGGRKKPLVIIFDQLEELFRLSRDSSRENQQDFFNQIANALDNENLSLRVVLVIREDYLAHLDPFRLTLPEKLRPRFRLESLNKDEAKEAIEKPLEKSKEYFKEYGISKRVDELLKRGYEDFGKEIETANGKTVSQSLRLVDKIVRNLCTMKFELPDGKTTEIIGEFVEPIYLQIVGQRLWEKLISAQSIDINPDYLEEVGDVDKALEGFYVDSVREASHQTGVSEDKIRDWCEKNLITSSDTRGMVHLDRTGEIPNNVIEILTNKYFVRREWRAGAPWYELTHDRLISPIKNSNKAWNVKQQQLRYEQEKQRAEQEKQRAEQEKQRAEQEKQRAEQERKKRSMIMKIMIPVITAIIIGSVLLSYHYGQQHAINIANGYAFLKTWGTNNSTGNGQLRSPYGVALDSAGNVYVSEFGNERVQKFTGDGTFITKWGSSGSGSGNFTSPDGIAVDSDGNVYVVDGNNDNIQKFTSNGTFITKWGGINGTADGQFNNPWGLAVDSAGNVYVADKGNNRIQKFTSNGTFITKWGSTGSGSGQLKNPEGIAVDSAGNVYVADQGNNRIQKFTGNGATLITTWGTEGGGNGQFEGPVGIIVDHSRNNVYVADSGNNRIQKFTGDGTFITKWGSRMNGKGQFDVPVGVAINHDTAKIYVADDDNNRVQKFTGDGTFITTWGRSGTANGEFQNPNYVAVDSAGNVYVTDYNNNRIQKFTGDGTFITKWGSTGSSSGQFNNPDGIAVDSDGNVYVADYNNNRIQKFTGDGTFITTWGSTGSDAGYLINPSDIAIDPKSQHVYVVDQANNRIEVFSPSSYISSTISNGRP